MHDNSLKTEPSVKKDLAEYKPEFLGPVKFIVDVLAVIAQNTIRQSIIGMKKNRDATLHPDSNTRKLP